MDPEAQAYGFYAGSRLLQPVSRATGLPLDQVNFLSCQLLVLVLAFFFRIYLAPHRASATTRHIVELTVGLTLTLFCFGYQIWILLAQSLCCLLAIKVLPRGIMEKVVCFIALGVLCTSHIYRQIYDYGGYTLDITGPLMINAQRMSSLGFSLADGACKDDTKLTENMRRRMVRQQPSLLEFFSYIFSFHMALVGPFCFYDDYISFIEGRLEQPFSTINLLVAWKLLLAAGAGIVTLKVLPHFPIDFLQDKQFIDGSFFFKMYYIIVCTSVTRSKYYFAWKMSEAINNNAGLAYNGKDKQGNKRWDLIDNAKIRNVEFSTSLKMLLDNWNMTTTYWLRHVVYDRAPFMKTAAVFSFSALWHGFYPGYYLTFAIGSLFISTSRLVRRNIRPHFQNSAAMRWLYEVLTFLCTRVALGYMTFPFVALVLLPSWETYKQLYFFGHILPVMVIVVLTVMPLAPRARSEKGHREGSSSAEENNHLNDAKNK